MLFTLKRDTPVAIGAVLLALPADTVFEIPGTHDDVAKALVQAGQKTYGIHVQDLTHEEEITRDGKKVRVRVTYGPGGARIETDLD